MPEPDMPELIGLRHIGLCAKDPATLAEFYQNVMGMKVVGGSDRSSPSGQTAFLSSHPEKEDHEIAILDNPDYAHVAFKVDSLANLREFHQRIVERGLPVIFQFNHGVSLSFYFRDPEDNIIEVYWATGLRYGQPYAHDIDLAKSEESLLEDVKALATGTGEQWPNGQTT